MARVGPNGATAKVRNRGQVAVQNNSKTQLEPDGLRRDVLLNYGKIAVLFSADVIALCELVQSRRNGPTYGRDETLIEAFERWQRGAWQLAKINSAVTDEIKEHARPVLV